MKSTFVLCAVIPFLSLSLSSHASATAVPIAVSGGNEFSLALKDDGTVWAWGANGRGQLGDGTTTYRKTPVQVSTVTDIVQIDAGYEHAVALKSDGTVWTWGRNLLGELGDGTTTQRTSPVQVSGLTNIVAVSAGVYNTMALKSDGTVLAWGSNGYGQLGDGTSTSRLSPGQVYTLAGSPPAAVALTGIVAIEAESSSAFALTSTGGIYAWGSNDSGKLGFYTSGLVSSPPATGVNVYYATGTGSSAAAIDGGPGQTVALSGGTVYTCGTNYYGQLGYGTTSNTNNWPLSSVSGLSSVIKVDSGTSHIVALKSDGTVWTWGFNGYGQLGDNSGTDRNTPTQVSSLSGIVTVDGGSHFTLAIKSDGTVWAWGRNDNGQLGDNSYINRIVPVQVTSF